jgi:hypothetical protein
MSDGSAWVSTGSQARHELTNLLHLYTAVSDGKDVEGVVALLDHARVSFPTGGFDQPGQARGFYSQLWSSDVPHRHDTSNVAVKQGPVPGLWTLQAHYTRWLLQDRPVLHTLGQYTLVADERTWTIQELIVERTWVLPA